MRLEGDVDLHAREVDVELHGKRVDGDHAVHRNLQRAGFDLLGDARETKRLRETQRHVEVRQHGAVA